jgi:hypothetical protein
LASPAVWKDTKSDFIFFSHSGLVTRTDVWYANLFNLPFWDGLVDGFGSSDAILIFLWLTAENSVVDSGDVKSGSGDACLSS